jgi:hypothetical protein
MQEKLEKALFSHFLVFAAVSYQPNQSAPNILVLKKWVGLQP